MKEDFPESCQKCSNPLIVKYKQIKGRSIQEFSVCENCPALKKRLMGSESCDHAKNRFIENYCCVVCHTSLEQIKNGFPMGCPLCYSVFETPLYEILKTKELIAPQGHRVPFLGKRTPDVEKALKSSRILELGQALNTAIAGENYEEAAWLRDQIKEITGQDHGS